MMDGEKRRVAPGAADSGPAAERKLALLAAARAQFPARGASRRPARPAKRVAPRTVFISYAHEDKALAEEMADDLTASGLSVWWDREVMAGQDAHAVIEDALLAASVVIVIWSPASVRSRWVRGEADVAAHLDKLVPVAVDGFGIGDVPLNFRVLKTIGIADRAGLMEALERPSR